MGNNSWVFLFLTKSPVRRGEWTLALQSVYLIKLRGEGVICGKESNYFASSLLKEKRGLCGDDDDDGDDDDTTQRQDSHFMT